jgi:hypothetical protein
MYCHQFILQFWIKQMFTSGKISEWRAGLVTSRTCRLDTSSSAAASPFTRTAASVGTHILFHRQHAIWVTEHSPLQEQTWDLYLALNRATAVDWLSHASIYGLFTPYGLCPPRRWCGIHFTDGGICMAYSITSRCKVKQFHHRSGQDLRLAGGRGSQISKQSAHEGGKVVNPMHRPPLPPMKYSWCSFLSTPEP